MSNSSVIGATVSFLPSNISIAANQKALKFYSEKLDEASKLDGDIPIFLDTNVLLDYYKISFTEREQLIKFFEVNKDRIYLTKQVETEFLRHRIDHIKSYLKSLDEFVASYRNIKTEIEKLKNGEIKGFDHYLSSNIILRNDYKDLRNELEQLNETIKEHLKQLFQQTSFIQQINEKELKLEEIKKRLEGQADIERNDPLLDVISSFQTCDELTNEEKEYVQGLYDKLNDIYLPLKGDNNHNWKHTFPGCGEKKEDPYGDFLIYHEMLKFMKENTSDAIFLTNDTTKDDWLWRNKVELVPYTHYIVNTFIATGQTMFVFQAKDKIRVSYTPIYVEDKKDEDNQLDTPANESIALAGLKVIGKIKLPNWDDEDLIHFDNYQSHYFSEITEEEFINELMQSQIWAKRYGENFVGERSFILKYLGGKGYDYSISTDVKNKLIEKGLVTEYIHKATKPYYKDVTAIQLTGEN